MAGSAADMLEADVCVVGAGYGGLTAAYRLHQAGRAVVVLEARDRVGGRIWTETRPDGTRVDRGGGWLGAGHTAAFALAAELGLTTYKTWNEGSHLLVDGTRIRRYKGLIPKISPVAVAMIAVTQARLDLTARRVPVEAPWTARRADVWDQRSVASWLARAGIPDGVGKDLFEMAVRGLFPTDLHEVSLLHLLFLVHAHRSSGALFSVKNGAQENLVDGGAGSMARVMAEHLGTAVHLGAPVRSLRQDDTGVVVTADGVSVRAAHAVVSAPPNLVLDIDFEPVLGEDRVALYRQAIGGVESKALAIYDEPFWRADDLSGQSAGPGSASEVTIDASPSSGRPGVLASFTFGSVARRVDAMAPGERRRAVLDALVPRFGAAAASPVDFVDTAWWEQEWTRGCSMAHLPPGHLTRYGHLLRQPFGRVHWAGTETASDFHGAIEGAIRSGERAAGEVLSA